MTTRRKNKKQNESTSIDEKEHADRIAAAEAMSCLSSMIVLPSNSEELFALAGDESAIGTKNANVTTKNDAKSATTNANKKGKTRTRGTKNSPPSTSKKNTSTNDKNLSPANKQKLKTPKYAPTLAVNSKKHTKLPDQVLSLTINPRNPNHEQKKVEAPKILKQELMKVDQLQPPILTPAFVQVDQTGAAKPCLIQVDHNKPGLGLYNLSSTDLHKILAGKLPFQVKADNAESQDVVAKSIASKLVTLASTESVELSQSVVDNLLSQAVLKQKPEANKESSESSLPLKKRRLQGYKEDDKQVAEDGSDKTSEQDTVSEKGEGPNTPGPPERVNSVAVDPSTSLMLLNEMQVALQQDEDGDLPLHIAVVHENIVMVQKFVHLMSISGKSVDKYNKAQQTPLHIAVELKFIQAVHTLLLAGSNPNLVNKNGENCIHMAVKANSLECLQLIFKYSQRTDINARNFDGLAPIHVAVMKNNMDIVRFLLAEKADINIQDGKSGRTPLFYAVEGNIVPMVELFQKVGANLDLPNYASITAVMAAQARGYHEVASMLLRCMDSKAYLEMKEKEKGTPVKKVPIPRIPSKSHLIQASDTKPGMVDLQQLTNSDSNDSTQSCNSRKQTKIDVSRKEKELMKQDDHERDTEKQNQIKRDFKQLQNGVQDTKTEVPVHVMKQENSEAILIPRDLLEKLQNTMLTLLAMQKVQQSPGGTNTQHSGTTTATSHHNSAGNVPIQSTSGVNIGHSQQNAFNVSGHTSMTTHKNSLANLTSKNSFMDAKTSSSPKTSDFVKDGRGHISNVHSERQQDSRTRHVMLQQLLNVKKSDLENSMEKKQKAMEYLMDNPIENRRQSMDNFIDRRRSVENAIDNSFERKQKSVENTIENLTERRQRSMESVRVEEPMDFSDSGGSPDSSQQFSSKFGKNQGGVGHAAMNQLGRVTNVSTSLQATLLQMLQAKQNKPLNLTTGKDSTNSS